MSRVQPTSGRLKFMSNHLINCQFVPASVKNQAQLYKFPEGNNTPEAGTSSGKHARSQSTSEHTNQEPKKQKAKQKAFEVIAAQSIPYTKEMQEKFENQLLRAYVSSGTAFNKINDPEVQKLFSTFMPSATLPTHQRLEGQILHRVVVQMEGAMKTSAKTSLATISCDGWKDVSRRHLVAFMVTMNREVSNTSYH